MRTASIKTITVAAGALLLGATIAPGLAAAAGKGHGKGHTHALEVTVHASPTSVLANGTATSKIVVKLRHGKAARNAAVTLTTTATPSSGTSCGTLSATSGTTGKNGRLAVTYTASSTVGFCTITATSGTATGLTTVVQTDPTLVNTHYQITASATPTALKADGTSTSTLTITVTNGATPVANDAVFVSERALHAGACGTIAYGAPTTDATGSATVTYTSSTTAGNCKLRAFEASTGSASGAVVR